jgi:hypothetical protein
LIKKEILLNQKVKEKEKLNQNQKAKIKNLL